jgi:sulfoxide reductase heme-binding subunit YedZ
VDQFFDWDEILRDIVKRPYITVGFTAFVLLIPLALTSTRNMVRRLGPHWRRLHGLVYVVGTLGIIHYLWLVKADRLPPILYGCVFIALLALRLPRPAWLRRLPPLRPLRSATGP